MVNLMGSNRNPKERNERNSRLVFRSFGYGSMVEGMRYEALRRRGPNS